MLDSVIVARDKFLKPGGALYPSHARMFMAPIRSNLWCVLTAGKEGCCRAGGCCLCLCQRLRVWPCPCCCDKSCRLQPCLRGAALLGMQSIAPAATLAVVLKLRPHTPTAVTQPATALRLPEQHGGVGRVRR